mgnify:CR=1 FL=1
MIDKNYTPFLRRVIHSRLTKLHLFANYRSSQLIITEKNISSCLIIKLLGTSSRKKMWQWRSQKS